MSKVIDVFSAPREQLVKAWQDDSAHKIDLGPVGRKIVPMRIQHLKTAERVENQAKALQELHYSVLEYKSLLLDILDAVDEAADLELLRANLKTFDIELVEGKVHDLYDWRASQLAKENGAGEEFYKETHNE